VVGYFTTKTPITPNPTKSNLLFLFGVFKVSISSFLPPNHQITKSPNSLNPTNEMKFFSPSTSVWGKFPNIISKHSFDIGTIIIL